MFNRWTFLPLIAALLAAACPSTASAALQAQEIAVIVNADNPDSLTLAQHYCQRRGVDPAHILSISMPDQEEIPSALYHDQIAPALRDQLRRLDDFPQIRCFLTVYGTPLRIARVRLSPENQQRLEFIDRLYARYLNQLPQLLSDYLVLAGRNPLAPQTQTIPKLRHERRNQLTQLLQPLAAAVQAAQNVATPDKLEQRDRLNLRLWGLQGQHRALVERLQSPSVSPNLKEIMHKEILRLEQQLIALKKEFDAIDPNAADTAGLERRYTIVAESAGLQTICSMLLDDWFKISNQETEAAFDSELSLILWPTYALGGWINNDLNPDPPAALRLPGSNKPLGKTLMVARLDGPTPAIVRRLIDDALAAEKVLLRGQACFDARGVKNNNTFCSTGFFDETIRRAADITRKQSALRVTLDDREPLLPADSVPHALLYFGWYRLRQYEATCRFDLGALAVHIASFEAETLGRAKPDSTVWCKRFLEEGVVATWGAVAEPYLHSFPLPDRFVKCWFESDLTLVECYYETLPFNSWMLTLVGDPLYRPQYAVPSGYKPVIPR